MNDTSSLLFISVGTAAAKVARKIISSYSFPNIRLVDTDAATGKEDGLPFTLIGGNRLAGRGASGNAGDAKTSFLDQPSVLDDAFKDVHTAVILTCLGGGTGNGLTPEIIRRLREKGIVTLVMATLPFRFEGDERTKTARSAMTTIEGNSDSSVFLSLDSIAAKDGDETLASVLDKATVELANGITLFWRLLGMPGYISIDHDILRKMIKSSGKARFATITSSGADRAERILEMLPSSRTLALPEKTEKIDKLLVGVLAGDSLRLSELSVLSEGLRKAFNNPAVFDLATVNDNAAFGDGISVVILAFDSGAVVAAPGRRYKRHSIESHYDGRDVTMWHDENLDIPTYLRKGLTLDK